VANLVHNERVKLRASTLAAIGTAFIIGGVVAPLVTRQLSFGWSDLLDPVWVVVGIAIRRHSLDILGELRE
jgi:hypothetical protein